MGLLFKIEEEEEDQQQQSTAVHRRSSSSSSCHLLWLNETGNDHHLILDPTDTSTGLQVIHLPQLNLSSIQCLASNHGWLLMLSRTDSTLFFYNPFTQAKLPLPYRRSLFEAAAFSAPPTSPNCLVYGVARRCRGPVDIGVLRMGEEKPMWRNYRFKAGEFAAVRAVVASRSSSSGDGGGNYSNKLWCVDCMGRVGVFEGGEGGVWRVVCGVKSEKVRSVGVGGVVEVGGELVVGVRREGAGKRGLGEVYVLKGNKKSSASGGGDEMGGRRLVGESWVVGCT
ncbi:hypothetical protein Syun_028982 [Stephania yunnanensis]|uniref:KIB1-4 beta-propeller domain-containing protein n=1 Tax=Stephania yunnanensis TaxID=152371 RepID=A0AAP0ECF5_9MAGN